MMLRAARRSGEEIVANCAEEMEGPSGRARGAAGLRRGPSALTFGGTGRKATRKPFIQ
jgi:hypothetical protein